MVLKKDVARARPAAPYYRYLFGLPWAGLLLVMVFLWHPPLNALVVGMPGLRPTLTGTSRPLIIDGIIKPSQLKQAGLSQEDLEMRLREMKISSPDQIHLGQLETDGKIGLVPKHPSEA